MIYVHAKVWHLVIIGTAYRTVLVSVGPPFPCSSVTLFSIAVHRRGMECYSKCSKANRCSASCLCIACVSIEYASDSNTELQTHFFQGCKTNSSISVESDFPLRAFFVCLVNEYSSSLHRVLEFCCLCMQFKSSLLFQQEHSVTIT